jgi:hypothetical protein
MSQSAREVRAEVEVSWSTTSMFPIAGFAETLSA